MRTMKAAVLRDIQNLELREIPIPACPTDGLLLRVRSCAVCATDVKIYNYGHRLVQLPRVLGHEVTGEIEALGPEVEGHWQVGQRVAVCAVINCRRCEFCARGMPSMCESLQAFGYHFDGGFEEVMAVPGVAVRCGGVNVLSPETTFSEGAMAELLACCINGQRLSDVQPGQTMLILGAGPVGILHTELARHDGASAVYLADINLEQLTQAQALCGERLTGTLDNRDSEPFVQQVMEITNGRGFDQVMVCCSAASAQQLALACVAKCGCVNLFGGLPRGRSTVELDTNHIHYKQCRLVGTHGSSAEENRQALDLIAQQAIRVRPLIERTISLEQLESALQIEASQVSHLKTVVEF